jgi:hypothetical protein
MTIGCGASHNYTNILSFYGEKLSVPYKVYSARAHKNNLAEMRSYHILVRRVQCEGIACMFGVDLEGGFPQKMQGLNNVKKREKD